ncbi:hypothetical protein SMSP2_02226 [Limihaloglobus sulfuriphilus]|uniref:Ice-binding protein C-terminal domain-containing protein n=1 Tax=Limihaloglobus sulfuriphilus TaxID=1851148 RepID=A0A1Q2MHS5_9BACT|nr:PEP-CTERM sorting domain-containing protein [Limihaloglobus sulfuriphilus]AQQ71847.1 hypothetical protein SMSP2_02226 [Limihaloglobus sulfuriphilus]
MKKTLITLASVLIAVSAVSAIPVKTAALSSAGNIDLFADDTMIELKDPEMGELYQVDESAVISGVLTNNCLYWALGLEVEGSEMPVVPTAEGYEASGGLEFVLEGFMPASGVEVNAASSSYISLSDSGSWFRPLAARTVFEGLGLSGAGIVNVYGYTDNGSAYLGSFEVVPEPSMLALFGIGGLILSRRRKA